MKFIKAYSMNLEMLNYRGVVRWSGVAASGGGSSQQMTSSPIQNKAVATRIPDRT
jgi:hypothetical protein